MSYQTIPVWPVRDQVRKHGGHPVWPRYLTFCIAWLPFHSRQCFVQNKPNRACQMFGWARFCLWCVLEKAESLNDTDLHNFPDFSLCLTGILLSVFCDKSEGPVSLGNHTGGWSPSWFVSGGNYLVALCRMGWVSGQRAEFVYRHTPARVIAAFD